MILKETTKSVDKIRHHDLVYHMMMMMKLNADKMSIYRVTYKITPMQDFFQYHFQNNLITILTPKNHFLT